MAELQRSALSFRRQGSSGHVWDDKFLGELDKISQEQDRLKREKENNNNPLQHQHDDNGDPKLTIAVGSIDRSRSNGGRAFRTGKVSPAIEPPSPKVSACGFCSAFGKREKNIRRTSKPGKRVK